MLGPKFLPLTSFKKDYSFSWLLTDNPEKEVSDDPYQVKPITDLVDKAAGLWKNVKNILKDSVDIYGILKMLLPSSLPYVSSFAKKVSLPDDEMELKAVEIGPYTFYTPKKKKMADISVSYYDDSYANVYRFHKIWQEMIMKDNEMTTMEPIYNLTVGGIYSYVEKDLSVENQLITEVMDATNLTNNQVASYAKKIFPELELDLGEKTISNYYPRLYPRFIKREEGSRDGSGLATVNVTYCRMPDVGTTSLSEVKFLPGRNDLEGTGRPNLSSVDLLNPPLTFNVDTVWGS